MAGFLRRNVLPICLFCYIFGIVIQWPVTQNMILQRICLRDHDESVCSEINKYSEVQDQVQSEASQFMTMQSVSTDVPGAVMSLVLGAASDRIGRKPVMLLPCLGLFLFSVVMLFQAMSVVLWSGYFVLAGVCLGGSGGLLSFMTATTNYITDTTPEESRTEKLSKTMSFMGLGAIAGMVASGTVSDRTAFLVCAVSSVVSLTFIYSFVGNVTVKNQETKTAEENSFVQGIMKNLKSGAQTLLAGKDPVKQRRLRMMIFAGMVASGSFMGGYVCIFNVAVLAANLATNNVEGNLVMLYTKRSPFEWTPATYGIFIALRQVATVIGQVAGPIVFFNYIGPRSLRSDYVLVQLTHIGFILTTVTTGIAATSSLVYFGIVFLSLTGPGQPAMGSITSRLVEPSEKGTFSAFSTFLNSLSVPVCAVFLNNMYSWSVTRGTPAFVFFFLAAVHILVVVLLGFVKPESHEEVSTKKEN